MSNQHKGAFFLITGLIMLMGTMGGVEQCLDLASVDGMYLFAFAMAGLALMMVGVSYVAEQTDRTMRRLKSLS